MIDTVWLSCRNSSVVFTKFCHSFLTLFSQAHVYSSESGGCSAFLANYDTESAARVLFNNVHYNLPPWSISILPDCRNAVFNTAKVKCIWLFWNWELWFLKLRLWFCLKTVDFSCLISGWSSDITDGNVADKHGEFPVAELFGRSFFSRWQLHIHHSWTLGADKCHTWHERLPLVHD